MATRKKAKGPTAEEQFASFFQSMRKEHKTAVLLFRHSDNGFAAVGIDARLIAPSQQRIEMFADYPMFILLADDLATTCRSLAMKGKTIKILSQLGVGAKVEETITLDTFRTPKNPLEDDVDLDERTAGAFVG